MAYRKRKLQEDAEQSNYASDRKDALVELGLHVSLRIAEAKRLHLHKVRLEMLDMVLAEQLLDLIRRAIDVESRKA